MNAVAIKRHTDAMMFQITASLDDGAAMIGSVSKSNHFEALCVLHR